MDGRKRISSHIYQLVSDVRLQWWAMKIKSHDTEFPGGEWPKTCTDLTHACDARFMASGTPACLPFLFSAPQIETQAALWHTAHKIRLVHCNYFWNGFVVVFCAFALTDGLVLCLWWNCTHCGKNLSRNLSEPFNMVIIKCWLPFTLSFLSRHQSTRRTLERQKRQRLFPNPLILPLGFPFPATGLTLGTTSDEFRGAHLTRLSEESSGVGQSGDRVADAFFFSQGNQSVIQWFVSICQALLWHIMIVPLSPAGIISLI